jgi:hypothetical protein
MSMGGFFFWPVRNTEGLAFVRLKTKPKQAIIGASIFTKNGLFGKVIALVGCPTGAG